MNSLEKPPDECRERRHPEVRFTVDREEMVVHTNHLTVREILDIAGADPSTHYIVELLCPEDIPHTNLDEEVHIRECAEFITVFTGETPLS